METSRDIDYLERLDLAELMRLHEIPCVRQTEDKLFYRCPLHNDSNPSFVIYRNSDNGKQGWKCFGCERKGSGAIDLQAALMGLDRKTHFSEICKELAKLFNVKFDGKDYSDSYHRAVESDEVSEEIRYQYRSIHDEDLVSLGCVVEQVYVRESRAEQPKERGWKALEDEHGFIKKYSWGKGFEDKNMRERNFVPSDLERMFCCHAVDYYISQAKFNEKKQKVMSWKVNGSLSYPIFDFHYQDEEGWWSKKYEPKYRSNDGASFKFTWWYQDGEKRDEFLGQHLYGDVDFMNAWEGGSVEDTYGGHPVVEREDGVVGTPLRGAYAQGNENDEDAELGEGKKAKTVRKFKRLVLCSGPRDGINTYFMSDCHVCWPHSESVRLSSDVLSRLVNLAENVYVMFDIDSTGMERANAIAMKNLKFKVIRLPREMSEIVSSRTGKPCKDASEYFSEYRRNIKDQTIRSHFQGLLKTAMTLQFWKRVESHRNTGNGSRVPVTKFEILNSHMEQFLPALGMWRYVDESGMSKFILKRDSRIQIIPQSEVENTAISLMKSFIVNEHQYYHEGLYEAISVSTKINSKTLGQLPAIELNFKSWGEDFDYFFLKGDVVHVTDKGYQPISYSALPYAVNEKAIIDDVWRGSRSMSRRSVFEAHYNDAYIKAATKKHEEELAIMTDPIEIETKKANFKKTINLWRHKPQFNVPVKEWPPFLQYLWNSCNFFWEQEEKGIELTEYQKQYCAIHFINMMGALGYLFSRYRTTRRQYIVEITDYIEDSTSRNGRNGKSTIMDLLFTMLRKVFRVSGQSFKSKRELIGLNFGGFVLTEHSNVYTDDAHVSAGLELFINAAQNMPSKTLYQNEVNLPFDVSPKMVVSHNTHYLSTNKGGTYKGRLWSVYLSDYYHEASDDGTRPLRTPETEFGDLLDMTDEESQTVKEFLCYCLSFYLEQNKLLGEQVRIDVPLESMDEIEKARRTLRDDTLWDWATVFFQDEKHFKRPMARSTMCLDFMRYRNSVLTPDKWMRLSRANLTKELTDFQKKIEQYLQLNKRLKRIVYNPVSVFKDASGYDSKPNAAGTCMMRKESWQYQLDDLTDEFDFDKPMKLDYDRCYYFYHEREVPKNEEEILGATPTP